MRCYGAAKNQRPCRGSPCDHYAVPSAVPSQSPADVLRRIRELAPGARAGHVTGQHVVSKVILRRFAADSGLDKGLLYPFRLQYPDARHRPLGPDGCGKVPDFVPYASASMEQLWKETEDKLHDALAAVDNGTLLGSAAHTATIKDTIALHYTRSIAARIVHFRTWEQMYAAERVRWLTSRRPMLEAAFYKTKGLYAAGGQALELFLDEMMQPSVDMAASGQLFRVRIEELFRQARERTSRSALEILTSGSSEFLIGDVPALTIRHDRTEVGVLGGIALDDANTVIMPLGPHHLAALARVEVTAELSPDQVASANARQAAGAVEYVYFRPGSMLEQFVRPLARQRRTTT